MFDTLHPMDPKTSRIVTAVCGAIFLVVVFQTAFPAKEPPVPEPEVAEECIGDPIAVAYEYAGWNEPHACAVQCADDQPRYILYSDGLATQCEPPPGCNDLGEDRGILCEPPLVSPAA